MLVLGVFELRAGVCVTAPENLASGRLPEALVEMQIIDCFMWIDFGCQFRIAVNRLGFSRGN
ncbi:MAG: hypothetical protein CMK71_04070 [Pseudomonadaceae bacterium]|nr:hypothetical protein [Pseudomonadaceae bacterium]|tara:strand:- start:1928 stop:2113 length:186 start_codon:yes stop_codon:yes gene_type:complete